MDVKQAEKMYKMFANRRRLQILVYLKKNKRASVRDIADQIHLSLKATSKHLLLLKSAGLVDSEQVSLEQYYFISDPANSFLKHALSIL